MRMTLRHQPQAILVTGGAGFIGSNFLHRMVPRYRNIWFVNLDKLTYAGNLMNLRTLQRESNYRFVRGDVADSDLVRRLFAKYRFATVVHFAAESHVDRSIRAPIAFAQSNVVGTVTLLEAARQAWQEGLGAQREVPVPARVHRRSLRIGCRGRLLHRGNALCPPLSVFCIQGRL